jgi:predicted TIM-barrel fold metal-dependent hydrolase
MSGVRHISDQGRLSGSRREFLRVTTALAAAAAGGWVADAAAAEGRATPGSAGRGALVDTNVTLSRWPERRLPLDDTKALAAKLRRQGVTEAWAGSFDGLLHKDIAGVNSRLAAECRKEGRGLLVPFGSINPTLPGWEDDLRRCHEEHRMPGIRLHPNYHRYPLDDPKFAKLLDLAGARKLMVQLVVSMEDERTQHPLMQAPNVDVKPLPALLKSRPSLRVILLNWSRGVKADQAQKLASAGQVFFDIATVESVGGVANLLKGLPADRLVFGSYAPFFYFESALLKLKESPLSEGQLAAIRAGNAQRCRNATDA